MSADDPGLLDRALPREHRWILLAFLVIAAIDLIGESVGTYALAVAAKVLLIPALILWVLAAQRSAAPRLLVAGLVLAWLGDIALMLPGDTAFMVGLALFLGFARLGAWAVLRSQPGIAVVGLVLWVGLNLALGPSLGDLRIPLLVYSLALTTMAVLACAVSVRVGSARVGVGGVVFLISDLLIGMGAANIDLPAHDVLVMSTYAIGQLLFTTGWVATVDRGTRTITS